MGDVPRISFFWGAYKFNSDYIFTPVENLSQLLSCPYVVQCMVTIKDWLCKVTWFC